MAILGTQGISSGWLTIPQGSPQVWAGPPGHEFTTMPEAGWLDSGFVYGRGESAQSKLYVVAYDASSGTPTALFSHTNLITAGAANLGWRGGSFISHPLIPAGTRVAMGIVAHTNTTRIQGASSGGDEFSRWVRGAGSNRTPLNPFAATGANIGTQLFMAMYINYTPNRAPDAPESIKVNGVDISTAPSSSTLTPTFSFVFSDPDQDAGYAEKIRRYEFRLKRVSTGAVIWPLPGQPLAAQYLATVGEQAKDVVISRPYPGGTLGSEALIGGEDYTLEIRTQDLSGTWGDYSTAALFTIEAVASVDVSDADPTGKVDTVTDEIDWEARWFHPAGTATTHVQVRVMEDGGLFKLGAEVAKVVASSGIPPGNPFTITAAEAGIGELPRGVDFTYQVRGQAGGVWSDWSPPREFRTNAPPNTPVTVSPIDGEVVTGYPLLTWQSSDPDADDIMGADVVWELRLTRPTPLSVLTFEHPTDTMTYDPELSLASFQLDGTDVPNAGDYAWEVRAIDLSAEAVLAGYGTSEWSDPTLFSIVAGPAPTLTLPAATVDTVSPLVRMTVANGPHVRYRAVVYLNGTMTRVWDSQVVESSSLDIVVPAGFLRNGVKYDVQVTVWNEVNQSGTSSRRSFTVTFTAPEAISNLTASEYAATRDPAPTAIILAWDQTMLGQGEFQGYVVRRRYEGEPESAGIKLATITNPAQNRWWDFHAPPNIGLTYSVSQLRRAGASPGNPIVEGPQTDASVELDLNVVVIATTRNPGVERFVLTYQPITIRRQPRQNVVPYTTWGSEGKPVMVSTPGTQEVFSITGTVVTDSNATAEQLETAIEAMHRAQSIVCVRDERRRLFGKITEYTYQPGAWPEPDTVSITIGETNYQEGA